MQEYSWAILPGSSYHEPDALGFLDGVRIPLRPDGVTRKHKPVRFRRATRVDDGARAGEVTVYYKLSFDEDTGGFQPVDNCRLELSEDAVSGKALMVRGVQARGIFGAVLRVKISGSTSLKIAYHCKAHGVLRAGINLFDRLAGDNTTSKAYRLLSEKEWRPILYYLGSFRYNSMPSTTTVRPQTLYGNIRFHGERCGSTDT